MKIRADLINDRKSGIENYPGYIPVLIRREMYTVTSDWLRNIEKLDNYHEIIRKMGSLRHVHDENLFIKELDDWLADNPEYSFLVEY